MSFKKSNCSSKIWFDVSIQGDWKTYDNHEKKYLSAPIGISKKPITIKNKKGRYQKMYEIRVPNYTKVGDTFLSYPNKNNVIFRVPKRMVKNIDPNSKFATEKDKSPGYVNNHKRIIGNSNYICVFYEEENPEKEVFRCSLLDYKKARAVKNLYKTKLELQKTKYKNQVSAIDRAKAASKVNTRKNKTIHKNER